MVISFMSTLLEEVSPTLPTLAVLLKSSGEGMTGVEREGNMNKTRRVRAARAAKRREEGGGRGGGERGGGGGRRMMMMMIL